MCLGYDGIITTKAISPPLVAPDRLSHLFQTCQGSFENGGECKTRFAPTVTIAKTVRRGGRSQRYGIRLKACPVLDTGAGMMGGRSGASGPVQLLKKPEET